MMTMKVLMMVGLPAAGKTRWIQEYLRDNAAERWHVVSTDAVVDAMRVCLSVCLLSCGSGYVVGSCRWRAWRGTRCTAGGGTW